MKLKDLRPDPNNLNRHTERGAGMMERSIRDLGFGDSMTVDRDGVVLSGNQRLETLADIQMDNPIVVQSDGTRPIVHQRTDLSASDPRGVALAIAQNRVGQVNLEWDIAALLAMPREQTEACFSEKELEILAGTFTEPAVTQAEARKTLAERFIVPPFSVLDARQGYWQERKRAWLALGIQSELGRAENLLELSEAALDAGGGTGTGVFDPVLCELAYKWFCPSGGTIVDPFSGGSVRGIVAAFLGFRYIGLDIRAEQVSENEAQAKAIKKLKSLPRWMCSDSRMFSKVAGNIKADFLFTSPPYFGREHYSDLEDDLNNSRSYKDFLEGYESCLSQAVSSLEADRFAAIEVAELRDPKGIQVDFVGDTTRIFERHGANFYNHAIHLKPLASAAIRAGKMFSSGRKLVPVHEHVLIFFKGDTRNIPKQFPEIEVGDLADMDFGPRLVK
ncbi:MAG: DNA methyltransferase [Methylococcaceae bacterium]|nr:DNA methyltransferase [Methylococcaceae bacterium]